ncbi:MAG: hypothetical protein KJ958_01635 [Gammaproteobacteria bacterium]|nr:hypothetical protein [Gammaproteobacteria bacterium]
MHSFFIKAIRLVATTGIVLSLTVAGRVASAQDHDHGHEHGASSGAPSALALKQGKKWPTDASLRQGMGHIRDAMEEPMPAIYAGKGDTAQFEIRAKRVNEQIAFMVQNCKLDKEADAMLHLVLAEIIAGVEAMEGKNKKLDRRGGAVKVIHALENYNRYFDHPGWRPLNPGKF